MSKVVAGGTVSLDGFIAGPDGSGWEHLFAWFDGGDLEFPSVDPNFRIHLPEPGAPRLRQRGEPDLNNSLVACGR